MLALLVGLIEIGLGLGKLGFVADLLSSEVQVGYMNGLAITIIVSQLPKLFGFSTDADGFVDERARVLRAASTRPQAGAIARRRRRARRAARPAADHAAHPGGARRRGRRHRSCRRCSTWPATASTTVGTLPQGFPTPSLPWTSLDDVGPLLIAAIGITLVSLTDTIATASSFAARRGDEVEPNQEMIGMGAANVAAGFFQGFAISTSGSRTAVAEQAGAKSQLTGVVGAGARGRPAALPQRAARRPPPVGARRRRHRRRAVADRPRPRCASTPGCGSSSLFLSLVATLGVVLLGVLEGIVVAIVLAVLLFFRRNWWPHGAVLGRTRRQRGLAQRRRAPRMRRSSRASSSTGGRRRCSSPTPAPSASRSVAWSRERTPRWIVLQCEAITDIDVTAAEMLEQLDDELNARGVHMAFVELRSRLQDLVGRYGLFETLDRDHFYPTIDAALAAIADETSAGDDDRRRVGREERGDRTDPAGPSGERTTRNP